MTIGPLDLLNFNMAGSVNDMVVKLGTVADLVTIHPGYQDPLPKEVSGPPEFRILAVDLHQLDQEAVNQDRLKRAQRLAKYMEAEVALVVFGQFAVMKAVKNNDTSFIDNIGFERKKKRSLPNRSANHGPVGAPEPCAVFHGPESGSVQFRFSRVKGAVSYDVYSCLGDPTNENSWTLAATFISTRSMRIDGLEPGKVYMFRVHCLGATGFGPWSNIIKIMVI